MKTLLISDLHLSTNSAVQLQNYQQLLREHAGKIEALYVLGDFFDFWIGDDATTDLHRMAVEPIRQLAALGTKIFFMHGNRDFAIGAEFLDYMQAELIAEPRVETIHGQRFLLLHGDELCTDDIAYQKMRAQIRNPQFMAMMLEKSIEERIAFAQNLRSQSKAESAVKADDIMDVNQNTVMEFFQTHQVDKMIHGHTHRPAIHQLDAETTRHRIVLGDWQQQASYLLIDENGCELIDPRVQQQLDFQQNTVSDSV